jgi:uncharacterized protein
MNNKTVKTIYRYTKILAIIYIVIGFSLYFLQDYFLLHPTKIDRSIPYVFSVPFKEVDIPAQNKDTINMVKFYSIEGATKGLVIYLHGNKGNINRYAKFAANFTNKGYEVWMPDYPGFGKSVGTINEQKLYNQAQQIFSLATKTFKQDSIIVYGKSFGTGIAAYLAAENKCQQLILETPYYSIPSLYSTYAPIYPTGIIAHYAIPTYQYLQKNKSPITIFHGTADKVIAYSNAAQLKQVLKPTDKFVTIPFGTHHNLTSFDVYHYVLDSILAL